MENKTKPYLSPTQITMYLRCGEQYRRRYIQRETLPPGIALIKGSALHVGAEYNFKQKIESHIDLSTIQIEEVAIDCLEKKIKNEGLDLSEEEQAEGKSKVVDTAKKDVQTFVELYSLEVAPKYQPVWVEETQKIELPKSQFDLLGKLDLIDDKKRIVDLKTSSRQKNQNEADTSLQLTFYAALYKKKTNEYPSEIDIEVLVNSKNPNVQVLTTTRNVDDMKGLVNVVNSVSDGITKGVFLPAQPDQWWCSKRFCGYWGTCPFVNSKIKNGGLNEKI